MEHLRHRLYGVDAPGLNKLRLTFYIQRF